MAVKAWKPLSIAASAVLAAGFVYFAFFRAEEAPRFIETTGVMEAAEAEVSSKIAGRIVWLCCREGDTVGAGSIAARLDARELSARVREGRAAAAASGEAVNEASAALESARVEREAVSHEVEAAEAEVDRATALANEAKENLGRAQGLFRGGHISRRDLDAAMAAYDSNLAQMKSAAARMRSAEAKLMSAAAGIRAAQARTSASMARRSQAEAQAEVLDARMGDAEIAAPLSGLVSYKAFEAGEYVNPGAAIYAVYDPQDLWARVDVEETRVQDISVGGSAEVTPSGGGRSFAGRVVEVGAVGGFATQRDVTRGRQDIKTFRVKVAVESPLGLLKPGMTVNVRIYFSRG